MFFEIEAVDCRLDVCNLWLKDCRLFEWEYLVHIQSIKSTFIGFPMKTYGIK